MKALYYKNNEPKLEDVQDITEEEHPLGSLVGKEIDVWDNKYLIVSDVNFVKEDSTERFVKLEQQNKIENAV